MDISSQKLFNLELKLLQDDLCLAAAATERAFRNRAGRQYRWDPVRALDVERPRCPRSRNIRELHLPAYQNPCALVVNGRCIELWVSHIHLDMNVSDIGARPALSHALLIAVRIRILIRPGSLLLESNGVDYKGIVIPRSNLFAKERWIWIFGVLAPIEGHEPIRGVPVRKTA
jgi:hypothetical protein